MDDPTLHCQPDQSAPSTTLSTRTMKINRMINSDYNSCPSRAIYYDRFIPSRTGSNFALFDISNSPASVEDGPGTYNSLLREALLGSDKKDSSGLPAGQNILRYKTETKRPLHSLQPFGFDDELVNRISHNPGKAPMKILGSPYQILDAPGFEDDFYSNLVDWSPNNVLAAGLGSCVYLWNVNSSKVTKLCDLGINDDICSIGWAQCGTQLAVGTRNGKVQIWDASYCRTVRTMEGHRSRVGTLAWSISLLSSGSRDKSILQRDIRARGDFVSKLSGHKLEVCGLKWSYDNRELASGGDDGKLFVWNQNSTQPVLKYCEHTAAVKAIAWSPCQHGLLASGGGTADRCIRFWNTTTNTNLSCMDTGSQVCNLVWSKNANELVSTHGYSANHIIVWRYPTMSKLATLTGHTYRVLHLAISPDGQKIVTGAGDETLRFWRVFAPSKSQNLFLHNTDSKIGALSFGRSTIR
ncbi:cell cycle switch protein 52 A1, FIZZY-related 2 [Hibiscus trionum]|uniref:Cell cycle switch protein 52 A1, FIZZY-related 2 n=1 Tax=Hibiscus trionum TaxID=183268 RepID=A0A9W7LIF5_HIBTR|nr:cell cycle switch protein 52 A1, FIZZY-related 2 [Hibiscus trionum]